MGKIITRILILLPAFATLTFWGCNSDSAAQYHVMEGFALGTTYRIIVKAADTTGIHAAIEELFEEVNNSMSVYRENSLLNRINRNETDSLDLRIKYSIQCAAWVSELSGGIYDITVKPLTEAWGFTGQDPVYRPNTDSLLRYVGYQKLQIDGNRLRKEYPEMQIELNSIAKGYTVDLVGHLMEAYGSRDYLVEIGGEVFCRGRNRQGLDWSVGIDKPADGNIIPGESLQVILSFTDKGLATSGNYRRFYTDADGNKVVHTINAVTGESKPSNLLSATVIAESCAYADALATMMMACGLERSIQILDSHEEIMAYLIYAREDGSYDTYVSPNLLGHIK